MSDQQQPMFPLPSDGSQSFPDATSSGYPTIGGTPTTSGAAALSGRKIEELSHPPQRNTNALWIVAAAIGGCIAVTAAALVFTRGADEDLANTSSTPGNHDAASASQSASGLGSNPPVQKAEAATPPRPDASLVALNVSVPISQPDCDGSGIVVLRSAVTPGNYAGEIQRYLNEFPGSSYLRTDHSCPSLRQATDSGDPIYAVYRPAGRTEAEICSAVRGAGGDAYGKWLDMTTDPRYMITC